MRKTIGAYSILAALGAALLTACGTSPAPSVDEMMKMYEQFNAPGPEHARLRDVVGTWSTETRYWMGPGEPTVCKGGSRMELILDGRYLKEEFHCATPTRPYAGMALLGYDNSLKKYVSVWMDNWSTGIIHAEGTHDPATKTTTMGGEYQDPLIGRVKTRSVLRELSKDKLIYETYRLGFMGGEEKEMEITYTRQ